MASAQLPMPIGTGVAVSGTQPADYEWRNGSSAVRHAVPALEQQVHPANHVMHAAGHSQVPPIVSPDQADSKKPSSMLAPIKMEEIPIVQDTQVTPATAQWPASSPRSNYRVVNGSRNMPVQIQSMDAPQQNAMPPIVQGQVMPDPLAPDTVPSSSTLVAPEITSVYDSSNQNYSAPVTQAPDSAYFNQPAQNPIYDPGGCSTCDGGGCMTCNGAYASPTTAACQSCGPGGCYNEAQVASQFGCAGSVSQATRYFMADVLWMKRSDGTFGATNLGPLPDFDADAGWRFTLGRRWDATAGDELSYLGTTQFSRSRNTFSNANNLDALFTVGAGLNFASTNSFFNAFQQIESSATELHSIEYNRISWNFDVAKRYIGIRGFYVGDDYSLFSESAFNPGLLEINAENFLIGAQVGLELFYDVGYRLSFSMLGEAGAYLNFGDLNTRLINGATTLADNSTDGTNISYAVELGFIMHYQLSREVRFRTGYTGIWMYEMVSATNNVPPVLTTAVGTDYNKSDDMAFQGLSFGIEIYR